MDDIRAFNFKQQEPMNIYADARVQAALMREFPYVFAEFKYPGIPQINIHPIGLDPFDIGSIHFIPIEVLHYKLPVLGFRINDFTYITDAKTVSDEEKEKIKGSKILVINALQKQNHISHFTLDEAIGFAHEIGAETTYFTHISHRLGKHADIEAELPAGIKLAYDGLRIEI
jgi:phosphoribosyl 1,2-cyclic phosphate phosphodiesterase